MQTNTEKLHAMMLGLRMQCDGASTLDDHGFAGPDVKAGWALASMSPASWTPEMEAMAYQFSIKYRRQLANLGFDVEAVEKPVAERVASRREIATIAKKRIEFTNGLVTVKLPPEDEELRREFKTVFYPRPRWDSNAKVWIIEPGNANGIEQFAIDFGFYFADGALEAIQQARESALTVSESSPSMQPNNPTFRADVSFVPRGEESHTIYYDIPIRPARGIHFANGYYVFMFEYDFKETFKDFFQTRRWNPDHKIWTVSDSEHEMVIAFAKEHSFVFTLEAQEHIAKRDLVNQKAIAASMAKSVEEPIDVPGLGGQLRPFQFVVVKHALRQYKGEI